jgi:hypothetical protein
VRGVGFDSVKVRFRHGDPEQELVIGPEYIKFEQTATPGRKAAKTRPETEIDRIALSNC